VPPVERRFAERHNIKVPLRVQMLRSAAPEQRAEALNISFQGVYFATNLPVPLENLEMFERMGVSFPT